MKTFTQYLEMAQEDYRFLDEFLALDEWTAEDGERYADALGKHDLLYHVDDPADDIIGFDRLPEGVVDKLERISQSIHDFPDALDAYFTRAVDVENAAYERDDETILYKAFEDGEAEGYDDGQRDSMAGKEYNDDMYLDYRGSEVDDSFEDGYRAGYKRGYGER